MAAATGHQELWTGYSLLHTEDEGRAHVQDLGSTGSCLQRFSPMPYLFCSIQSTCTYASRTATSYWLSTEAVIPMMPVTNEQVSRIFATVNQTILCG